MQEVSNKPGKKRAAFKAAFPHTIPILAGFAFLGLSYGFYMSASGFSFWYPFLISLTVFGGSLQFVAVTMLLSPFAPLQTFLMALMIQARHLFYGLAILPKYKNTGWKKLLNIFWMCDESFSINCSAEPPEGVDRGWFMFFVSLLNYLYWLIASTIGGMLGSLVSFDVTGLDFVMTAMFTVIFLEQWLKEKKHYSSLIGIIAGVICLNIFGKDSFLIPTMVCILVALTVFRKPIERGEAE